MADRTGGSSGGEDAPRAADIDGFGQDRGAGGDPGDGSDRDPDEAQEEAQDDELDLETPEADAAEQRTDLVQDRDEPPSSGAGGSGTEADPADLAEQRRVVGPDEEDYR